MTTGELARMFKAELNLQLDLTVVELKGWKREQWFDQTGLWWTNPSPNIRNLTQALLYPGIGLLETTNLSVGRGTDTPFEVFGAPWIDGRILAKTLNELRLPGVSFTATRFTPSASKYENTICEGVQISVTNRDRLEPNRLGLAIAVTLRSLYRKEWDFAGYIRLLGNRETWRSIDEGRTIDQIIASQELELLQFKRRRGPFLIYR